MRFKAFLASLLLALLFAPVYLFAQEVLAPPDLKKAGADAILALIPVTTLFVVWGAKWGISKLPASVAIMAVPIIGIGLNYGLAWLAGQIPGDPLLAAAFACLATYGRELATTVATKGLNGPVTLTKFNF